MRREVKVSSTQYTFWSRLTNRKKRPKVRTIASSIPNHRLWELDLRKLNGAIEFIMIPIAPTRTPILHLFQIVLADFLRIYLTVFSTLERIERVWRIQHIFSTTLDYYLIFSCRFGLASVWTSAMRSKPLYNSISIVYFSCANQRCKSPISLNSKRASLSFSSWELDKRSI